MYQPVGICIMSVRSEEMKHLLFVWSLTHIGDLKSGYFTLCCYDFDSIPFLNRSVVRVQCQITGEPLEFLNVNT